jgi:peroxiredoxin Q/BCP
VVIGISTDKLADQQKFTDKEKLNFPLFADTDKKVTKAYGVLNEKRGMANRSTFVIDKKGVVRKIYAEVKPADHPKEVLKFIEEELK